MDHIKKGRLYRSFIFASALLTSAVCVAHGGYGGGGGYHGGGGGYYHGGGGYYHGGGGYYHGGGWGGGGIVIGVPGGYYGGYGPGYYAPTCQSVRICNDNGSCWLQQECD